MSPKKTVQVETAAMPREVLSDPVAAVKEDSPELSASVEASVQRSQEDANNCMMGGWTS
ncbi:hypothetical protein ACFPM3_00040 [Streptomyces coeruleoprunus]|uniref:Uncharacterized protein n=1 Tax=Streptomyces coeruleoprunus TaxID=285563 RepID=A0ABV9X604_9ACTN